MSPRRNDSGDPQGILEAAARKRDGDEEVLASDTLGVEAPPSTRRARKKTTPSKPRPAKRAILTDAVVPGAQTAGRVKGPGWITRGVQAGLRGVDSGMSVSKQLGVWGVTAASALVALCVLSGFAAARVPDPAPVRGMRMVYLDGPRLNDRDLFGLIRRYPGLDQLRNGDDAQLQAFAVWLRAQSAIREVSQVRCVHSDSGERRVVEIELGLRTPELPVVLASGSRAWIDAEGVLLPGIMPAPEDRNRPVMRGLEGVERSRISEGLWLWRQLSTRLESGLVTDIHLNAPLGLLDQRGIVLTTRSGSQLIWGLPGDARYGVDRERKVRDLVHNIRCQGDLSRIATINVRYNSSFFTLRP